MAGIGLGFGRMNIAGSCLWRARREAARVLLATILYRRDHGGQLPEKLSNVVPKYLAAVPLDPFNGKPMLYDARKEVVYSVGQNLVDDGGEITAQFMPKDVGLSLAIR